MTTMNQQDRALFLQTLQDDAQFRNEVRNLLLARELIELPERFAQFASFVTTFIERQEKFNERQETLNQSFQGFITEQREFNERQEEFNQRQEGFNERQETLNQSFRDFITEQRGFNQRQEEFNQRQEGFNQRQEEFNQRQEEFNQRQEGFNQRQEGFNQRTEDTLGILKGNAARRLLNDSFETILDTFRLDFVSFLHRSDLVRMARRSGLSKEVNVGQRQSFYRADMVLEGIDEHGDTHYVAAEASFTADLRDSDRAIRNAGFLTRMTGHVAHPVVASVSNDRAVQELVEVGTIHWLQFDPKELEAD